MFKHLRMYIFENLRHQDLYLWFPETQKFIKWVDRFPRNTCLITHLCIIIRSYPITQLHLPSHSLSTSCAIWLFEYTWTVDSYVCDKVCRDIEKCL